VLLNKIPLAALAAVLIMVGYKLAKPSLFLAMYKEGQNQFVPFAVTIVAIVFTDLLKGIGIGLVVGLGYVLYTNFRSAVSVLKDGKNTIIKFNKDIFFRLNALKKSELNIKVRTLSDELADNL
jgi:MFS superfamily sulfate permease-like transporter